MISLRTGFLRHPLLKETVVLLSLFVIITLAFYSLVLGPVVRKTEGIKNEVGALKSEVVEYGNLILASEKDAKRLEEIRKNLEDMKDRYSHLTKALPRRSDASGILREISLPQTGLKFVSVRPSAVEERDSYLRLPVFLQIRGDFSSLGGYLSRIESSRKFITIDSISMVKDTRPGLLAKINMSIYLMPQGLL